MSVAESNMRRDVTATARPAGLISLFAWMGAGWLALAIWCWTRWILSDNFRPVDPGPDPLPAWRSLALIGLQVFGLIVALYCVWRYALKPRMRTGRFTTEGLVCLALPTVWFQDLTFGYAQTWMTYDAHLWNMGSWAAQFPGWMARHPENMLEPFVTFYGYIFWMFCCMLLVCAVMRAIQRRWPAASQSAVLAGGLLFTFVLDCVVEQSAVRLGWYAIPGAWRAASLFAGTPYQLPIYGVFFGAVQTFLFSLVLFYRNEDGYSFVENGVDELKAVGGRRTFTRYLALVGAFQTFFLVSYTMPSMWSALHSDEWVDGMPSYFTAMCPEYPAKKELCGGAGIPAYRPEHNWLPEK
jgi:hypothetical protein